MIAPLPPFRGGIAKYCYAFARELEQRHDLLLLSYRRQYPALLYGKRSQIDPTWDSNRIRTEFRQLSYDIDSVSVLSWRETALRVGAFGPDLVILPWWVTYWTPLYAYLLAVFRKQKIRVLFLCINIYEHEDSALKKLLTRFTLKRVNSMIVHSEAEKLTAQRINPRAVVINHPLPLFEYELPAAERPDPAAFRLLFFGFVRPYKGLDTLLKALHLLRDRDDVRLTVAGEFWSGKEEYIDLIRTLDIEDRVEIIDRYLSEDEIGLCFARADLIVLPYRASHTSGVIATAYGFGKPVLVTDVGGFREVVRDKVTGRLVPADDPDALADGIRWFLENRQFDFAADITAFTSRSMSWRSLADAVESLLEMPS